MADPKRIILVEPCLASSEVLVRRLTAQGYTVDTAEDPATGADMALALPPTAVVADLWMPRISGVQLCRLLRAEPATAKVPIILCSEADDPRSRFWAERAGATAFVRKGRMGELFRALSEAARSCGDPNDFFMRFGGGQVHIRDRIAAHLDRALFDSVIAGEVRALATCGSFERVFDLLSQLAAQLLNYRWMAVATSTPGYFGVHCHPGAKLQSIEEARKTLDIAPEMMPLEVVDGDAHADSTGPEPLCYEIPFGDTVLGKLALAPLDDDGVDANDLCQTVARELGGPLRMAALVEEQRQLATIDPLTGLMNRRSFVTQLHVEMARVARYGSPLSVILLDLDHFKTINDAHGHAAGDQVLAAIGELLHQDFGACDLSGRWGGEEFVLALYNTDISGAEPLAERIRSRAQDLKVTYRGKQISVTASLGLTRYIPGEPLEALIGRADRAMYEAKTQGRNRVVVRGQQTPSVGFSQPKSVSDRTRDSSNVVAVHRTD